MSLPRVSTREAGKEIVEGKIRFKEISGREVLSLKSYRSILVLGPPLDSPITSSFATDTSMLYR